jgi:hypothetical protein
MRQPSDDLWEELRYLGVWLIILVMFGFMIYAMATVGWE